MTRLKKLLAAGLVAASAALATPAVAADPRGDWYTQRVLTERETRARCNCAPVYLCSYPYGPASRTFLYRTTINTGYMREVRIGKSYGIFYYGAADYTC